MATKIYSFGFKYGLRNGSMGAIGTLVIDIRPAFGRNPFHDKNLRKLRGDHQLVIADILKTPKFMENYSKLKEKVKNFNGVVYLGCTGGHHRSVYLAER